MLKLVILSKSCNCLLAAPKSFHTGSNQANAGRSVAKSASDQNVSSRKLQFGTHWNRRFSDSDTNPTPSEKNEVTTDAHGSTREEYILYKEDFKRRFVEKQRNIQIAFVKLYGLRSKRAQRANPATFDVCASSTGAAESEVKIGCMRATECLHDMNLTVAVDRMAEAGVQKFENSERERRRRLISASVMTDLIPMYRE